ncbi:hypothetical protein LWI29_000744 [Acer saccharum]|uniref:AB hydrolase-1 domain-containing protein n=1 Tax=Acer saccharum TaxID=4024 RepID=A0AA39S5X4_ACESA|nr:hypothetical protein LWI29_000744 [Acer saccharum]
MVSQLAKLSSSSLLFWSDHQGPDEPESITHRAFRFPKRRQLTENVLIVHGLGVSSFLFRGMVESLGSRGVRVIAVDLPGSGFSNRSAMEVAERSDGSLPVF